MLLGLRFEGFGRLCRQLTSTAERKWSVEAVAGEP
jgi:hypothetical protein